MNEVWEKVNETAAKMVVPGGWLYKTWEMKFYSKEWGIFPFNGVTEGWYKANIEITFVPEIKN